MPMAAVDFCFTAAASTPPVLCPECSHTGVLHVQSEARKSCRNS